MRTLGLLLLMLALVLLAVFRLPARPPADPTPEASSTDPWEPPVIEEPDSGDLLLITGRPLFQPKRRPPAPEPAEDPTPDPPRVRLSAVTVSSNVRVAVIKQLDTGDTRRVREGEKLNQWTVKRVLRNQIVLQWKERETTIPLFSSE